MNIGLENLRNWLKWDDFVAVIETLKNPGVFTPFCDGKIIFDSFNIDYENRLITLKSKYGQELNISIVETVTIDEQTEDSVTCTFTVCDFDTPNEFVDYITVDFCSDNVL